MWTIHTPGSAEPTLLAVLSEIADGASMGAAAFAFATAGGIKQLFGEESFDTMLKSGDFTLVVGLDAITDQHALEALKKLRDTHAGFHPLAFLHHSAGLFHPKTCWFKNEDDSGAVLAGSGNLTSGGLGANWEASAVHHLDGEKLAELVATWNKWIADHGGQLLEVDHPDAIARAKLNRIQRVKVQKALQMPDEAANEELVAAVENAVEEASTTPFLIAEVPKSGDRWKQVNFDQASYQSFFGVTLGVGKDVEFRQVKNDGTLGPAENRHAVAVKSHNYRFEVGAANGLAYPAAGHPIVVFEKVTDALFYYVLLMPGEANHTLVQDYVNANYAASTGKRRVIISLGDLKAFWPGAPFFA